MEKYAPEVSQTTPQVPRPEMEDVFSPTHSRIDLISLTESSVLEEQLLDEENLENFLQRDFRARIA